MFALNLKGVIAGVCVSVGEIALKILRQCHMAKNYKESTYL